MKTKTGRRPNPVAKYAARMQRAAAFRDRTKYRRQAHARGIRAILEEAGHDCHGHSPGADPERRGHGRRGGGGVVFFFFFFSFPPPPPNSFIPPNGKF